MLVIIIIMILNLLIYFKGKFIINVYYVLLSKKFMEVLVSLLKGVLVWS